MEKEINVGRLKNSIKEPSDRDKKEMDSWKDNEGYVCGNKPGNDKFIMKKTIEVRR